MVNYTDEMKAFIQENIAGTSYNVMKDMFNARFNTDVSKEAMKGIISRLGLRNGNDCRFKTGAISHNKGVKMPKSIYEKCSPTMFKKGNIPNNYKPVGSERLSKDGYVEIKIADPNKWSLKHKHLYEKENGPVPKGKALIFADGNKSNFSMENLILVTRAELLKLNQMGLIYRDKELTEVGLNIVRLVIKKAEKVKGDKNA